MISNVIRGDFARKPLYRLERESHTIHWIKGTSAKRLIADALLKLYPEGVGVCSDTCRLMAFIRADGRIVDVPNPWPYKPIHLMVNNPEPSLSQDGYECPCMSYYDPEINGPWRERGIRRHHPFCMYEAGSVERAEFFIDQHKQTGKLPDRPDAWFRSLRDR